MDNQEEDVPKQSWYRRNREKVLARLREKVECDNCHRYITKSQIHNHKRSWICLYGYRKPRKDKIYRSQAEKVRCYYHRMRRVECEYCCRTVAGWYLKKHQRTKRCRSFQPSVPKES